MKLHFESNLAFQLQAIEAACDLFYGQKVCRTDFTVAGVSVECQTQFAFTTDALVIGNRLSLKEWLVRLFFVSSAFLRTASNDSRL